MMEKIKSWLEERFSAQKPAQPRSLSNSGYFQKPRPGAPKKKAPEPSTDAPDVVEIDPSLHSQIESGGPGKNVLIGNRFIREDTGTHETLTIVNDSSIDSGEESGMDPYNTGQFDRSKNWAHRFRK